MSIRTKVMLSIAVGAIFTTLAAIEIALLGTRSVGAVVMVMFVFCAAAAVVGLFIADSVEKPLDKVSRELADISTLALRNADNSKWARQLAAESNDAVGDGDAAVKRMAKAIKHIKISSDNNAKIIKAVNYMALRANYLALNASIAASHANDSNNAFACVADEVRSFAIRCAWTAQNTADMIEESVKDVAVGVNTAEDVANSIRTIADRADNVDGMITEIARISDREAKGIRSVEAAVTQINPVVLPDVEEPAGVVGKVNDLAPEQANAAGDSADSGPETAANGRNNLPPPKNRYAAYPYSRTFSAAGLAFWTPIKAAGPEEVFTIDDCEMWR